MLLLRKLKLPVKKHYSYFWGITRTITWTKKLLLRDLMVLSSPKQQLLLNKVNNDSYILNTNPINSTYIKNNLSHSMYLQETESDYKVTQYSIFSYNKNGNWSLVRMVPLNNIFYKIIDLAKNKLIYQAGAGNYIISIKYNKVKRHSVFLLPSKRQLVTSEWVIGLLGRNSFYKTKNYIAPFNKNLLRPKSIKVRGVAKNPVDHHNGGRAKRKPLFLNKYNRVAKYNK